MIRILTIDPQASRAITFGHPPTMQQLCGWVGVRPGYLQLLPIVCGDHNEECQLWIDEEGKLARDGRDGPRPRNEFATVLWYGSLAKLRVPPAVIVRDYIAGNAVLLSGVHKME